jgi:hypothetical protein
VAAADVEDGGKGEEDAHDGDGIVFLNDALDDGGNAYGHSKQAHGMPKGEEFFQHLAKMKD